MTVFAGEVHRDNLAAYTPLATAMLTTPRFAPEDFERLRNEAIDYVTKTLRGNNDEELGKWTLQARALQGPPLRPRRPRDGRGPEGDHARRREGVPPQALHAAERCTWAWPGASIERSSPAARATTSRRSPREGPRLPQLPEPAGRPRAWT